MPLQDLTPQLRTRLSRMERAVGWFVFFATFLLVCGFGYYIYHTAERKGWFKIKAPFFTYVQSAAGLSEGDSVLMMGFPVGQITRVFPMQPHDPHDVRVEFEIKDPFFRYIWAQGSIVKVNSADLLGKRQLEVTRGTNGPAICVTQPAEIKTIPELEQLVATQTNQWQLYQDILDENSNIIFHAYKMLDASNLQEMAAMNLSSNSLVVYNNQITKNYIVASWHRRTHSYINFTPNSEDAWLHAAESPAIVEQLQDMVGQVQSALPGILSLTNQIATVLNNAAVATSNLNGTISAAQPMLTNFALISAQLREPGGAITWALGTNNSAQIPILLTNANLLLTDTDTNLNKLVISLGESLNNLADITSNLNMQVQENPNLLFGIVKTIGDADDFVQGLKHHWLLRSAFKDENKKNDATKK